MNESRLTDDPTPQPRTVAGEEPLTIPSFPKAANEWGYTGSRPQGPNRAFSIVDAKSYEEHIELSGKLPFPVGNGEHAPPEDVREAARFIKERGAGGIRAFWNRKPRKIRNRAQALREIREIKGQGAGPSKVKDRAQPLSGAS